MRRISKCVILLIPALLMFGTSVVCAQNQKIGYIDSDYILSKIPEYSGIKDHLQTLSKGWKDQIQKMQEKIDQMQKDYEAKEILYTPEVRKEKKKDIQEKVDAKKAFVDSKFGPNGEYFQKQKELLQPLQQKIIDAVNKVAQREGYDFVFDRSGDYLFLYTRSEWNLSDKVLLQLGIQVDESSK
ncbi:MAG TPA: OmpH family outer membrane protein [Balneolales bacterium]|nr:OmpH family outer membrane protein [Balneolales bacterium]